MLIDKDIPMKEELDSVAVCPTLFALYIEPLVQMIRHDSVITGIELKKQEHVIGLFADDVLIALKNPTNCFI